MMFRRRLASCLLAASACAGALAQPQPTQDPTNLNLRFANGIVAVAEDRIITVGDVTREIAPLIQQIRAEARSEKEFNERVEAVQDNVIQELIDRVLIIKEFRKDEKKQIPTSFIDNAISDRIAEQFDNDRSKFHAYLNARGTSMREFRKEVEEDIIYHYMRGQQQKSQSIVSPVRIETYYNENKDRFYQEDKVHLRMIQLARTDGETDETLMAKANQVIARFKNGEKFEDLAREYSSLGRAKGGDWGWMNRSDFKAEFRDPAFALKKGEASAPILLPEGCFILYAEDRKFAGIQPLDEVRDVIERLLIQQMGRNSQERWLERLRRNAYVKHY